MSTSRWAIKLTSVPRVSSHDAADTTNSDLINTEPADGGDVYRMILGSIWEGIDNESTGTVSESVATARSAGMGRSQSVRRVTPSTNGPITPHLANVGGGFASLSGEHNAPGHGRTESSASQSEISLTANDGNPGARERANLMFLSGTRE